MSLLQLQTERRAKVREARALIRSINEKTPDREARKIEREFDAMMSEVDELDARIDDLALRDAPDPRRPMGNGEARGVPAEPRAADDHVKAFNSWLRAPSSEARKAELTKVEQRVASGLTGAGGGFVVPELIQTPIMSRARDVNPFRSIVRVVNVESGDVKFPISEADATQGWAAEEGTRSATTEPTLASKTPTFGTNYALVSMTEELAQDGLVDISQWFADEAGRAMGQAEMSAVISGNGTAKPTGFLNTAPEAAADGSRTANALRYLPSGAADDLGSAPADLLISTVYDLHAQYRPGAAWVMNSATASTIRKLKHGDGTYIWSDSFTMGQPPMLLGYPVFLAESMPDIGTDNHCIAFGNWNRGYVLAQRTQMMVTPDPYTTPGQIRVYLRYRVGGCTYDENAVRVIKCAAS